MEKMKPITSTAKPLIVEAPITIGIDVSKDHLDAARYPTGDTTRVANTRKGHMVLLRWISKNQVTRVVFEATGTNTNPG